MLSEEIIQFIEKLQGDDETRTFRRQFLEQYEWLESFWNQKYQQGNADTLFNNEFNIYYWSIKEIKQLAAELASLEPVGNSNANFTATPNVMRATMFLRSLEELKDLVNNEVKYDKGNASEWKNSPFHALMEIIKQIRNNLFHGRKTETGEIQYSRNKILVDLSRQVTKILLDKLEDAERSTIMREIA